MWLMYGLKFKLLRYNFKGLNNEQRDSVDRNYAKLKLSDGTLYHLKEVMLNLARQQGISSDSSVIKFIMDEFYGSIYIDIVDDLVEKLEIELFGKLFLAAIEFSDAKGCFNYFEIPDDPELESFYYSVRRTCFEPADCCDYCIAKVNSKMLIEKTGGIFKQVNYSAEFYGFANKILEYAAKLED
jgi:hypothetical protein